MPNSTVRASAEGLPKDVYALCSDLELEVRRARNMAGILARLIADTIRPGYREGERGELVHIEDVVGEAIDFAACDVSDRLRALEKAAESLTVAMGTIGIGVAS